MHPHSHRVVLHTAPSRSAGCVATQAKELPFLVAAPGTMLVAMEKLGPAAPSSSSSSSSSSSLGPTQRSRAGGNPPSQRHRRATSRRSAVARAEQVGLPAGGSVRGMELSLRGPPRAITPTSPLCRPPTHPSHPHPHRALCCHHARPGPRYLQYTVRTMVAWVRVWRWVFSARQV